MLDTFKTSGVPARRTTLLKKIYRCYFIDADDRIRSYEQIECEDDAAAALKVEQLLTSSTYRSGELWQGKRLVGKWGTGANDTGSKE